MRETIIGISFGLTLGIPLCLGIDYRMAMRQDEHSTRIFLGYPHDITIRSTGRGTGEFCEEAGRIWTPREEANGMLNCRAEEAGGI